MKQGGIYIDPRETDATDQNTIASNLVTNWKHKRRIIDVITYQGAGWLKEGDLVDLSIDGAGNSTDDYQIIGKQIFWGDKYPTRSGLIIFRLCEWISGTQSIYRFDWPDIVIEKVKLGIRGEAFQA